MRKTILLWDIDGTLLDTNSAGVAPLTSAVSETLGIVTNFNRSECAGLTDYQIIKHMAKKFCSQEVLDKNIDEIIDKYNTRLEKSLQDNPAKGLNNIEDKLNYLLKFSLINSHICTGNNLHGAYLKLNSANLYEYFASSIIFSAKNFSERASIVRRAKEHFEIESLFVIGDTLHDIQAARAANLPAIIIGSKNFPVENPSISQADYILPYDWKPEELLKIVSSLC